MESIWSESCRFKESEPLRGDIEAEIAVIGAGITGLLTASALQKAGRQVVVLEANRIASGQTRNTTAKITSQHGMIYRRLIDTLGRDKAKQYAMANEAAIEAYQRLVVSEHIDCAFEERNAYVYGADRDQLHSETEAAASLGLPASFVRETALPFSTAGVVCCALGGTDKYSMPYIVYETPTAYVLIISNNPSVYSLQAIAWNLDFTQFR